MQKVSFVFLVFKLMFKIYIGLIFSWISVWLPEEFVEGRVFVALTVFLTLSSSVYYN